MNQLSAEVARDIAMALSDPAVRRMVYTELQSSPYRENKLHFATFLRGPGQALLQAMAGAGQRTEQDVLTRLDSIVDLEFYMPVPAHRNDWSGGAELIVATTLDDQRVPDAYALTGNPFPVSSAHQPPDTPALVVVPVETDFSQPQQGVEGVAPLQAIGASDPGVYMTYSSIGHDYEGWPNGHPEFETHTTIQDEFGEYNYVICSGEQQTSPLLYNQDDEVWSGDVLLILESGIDGNKIRHEPWEDDTDPASRTAVGGLRSRTRIGERTSRTSISA